jgi:mRNA interferase MazF
MTKSYCPERGDVVWLEFMPQYGHEQSGRRPALTLSPASYNRKVGLAIFCPITNQVKGYPFEVLIPKGSKASGAILSDQVKSLDWKARNASKTCRISGDVIEEVLEKIGLLLGA